MKTWQEIKDEYAQENGFWNWDNIIDWMEGTSQDIDKHIDAVSLLRAKQALENASENAIITSHYQQGMCMSSDDYEIDKESITDENNIPL